MAKKNKKGSVLIEVVVVAAILATVSLTFFGTLAALSQFHEKDSLAIKGQLLAEEGVEALRFIKGGGWQKLADIPKATDMYLELKASSWEATTTPEFIDGRFFRSFRVYDVSRDAADNVAQSAGAVDPGTLLLKSKVEWQWRNATSSAEYQSLITDI